MCDEEKNINNYYSSDVWNKFSEAVAKTKLVIEDEAINDLRVNDSYWGLFDSFTSLCAYNKLSGDVDFDGKVTVRDATLIQKGIANLTTLNISQINVANVNGTTYEINIKYATHIQKYVAGLTDAINNNYLEHLSEIEGNASVYYYKENQYFYGELYRTAFPFY